MNSNNNIHVWLKLWQFSHIISYNCPLYQHTLHFPFTGCMWACTRGCWLIQVLWLVHFHHLNHNDHAVWLKCVHTLQPYKNKHWQPKLYSTHRPQKPMDKNNTNNDIHIITTRGIHKEMPPERYLEQTIWPWRRNCPIMFFVPYALLCHVVQLSKYSGLHCIWFKLNDLFSAVSKRIKQQDDTEFFYAWKWNSLWNSPVIIGLLWWRYCGHKYCSSLGKKIMGQWWKLGHEWPAAVWKASQSNS
jgi:hypothetical protein